MPFEASQCPLIARVDKIVFWQVFLYVINPFFVIVQVRNRIDFVMPYFVVFQGIGYHLLPFIVRKWVVQSILFLRASDCNNYFISFFQNLFYVNKMRIVKRLESADEKGALQKKGSERS